MSARELSAGEAVGLVKRIDSDVPGLGLVSTTPGILLEEFSQRGDWQYRTFSGELLGNYGVLTHPKVHSRSTFYGGAERPHRDQGADIDFITSFFHHDGLLIQHLNARVMTPPASRPDMNGEVSRSLYKSALFEECRRAGADLNRLLFLECSPYLARTRGIDGYAHTLRLDEVDVIVTTDARPTVLRVEAGTRRTS